MFGLPPLNRNELDARRHDQRHDAEVRIRALLLEIHRALISWPAWQRFHIAQKSRRASESESRAPVTWSV
jgi:hypothetical protein